MKIIFKATFITLLLSNITLSSGGLIIGALPKGYNRENCFILFDKNPYFLFSTTSPKGWLRLLNKDSFYQKYGIKEDEVDIYRTCIKIIIDGDENDKRIGF